METSSAPRPFYVRFFRWFFSWRIQRRLLISAAVLATLFAILWTVENVRGRKMWEKYRAELAARNVPLDLAKLVPPPVPDEQNLAAIPLVQDWFGKNKDQSFGTNYDRSEAMLSKKGLGLNERHLADLPAWAQALALAAKDETTNRFRSDTLTAATLREAAPAVLAGLAETAPALEALQAASKRPSARYPINYTMNDPLGILLPHLTKLRSVGRHLQLRTSAQLALDEHAAAHADVLLNLRLADSVKNEPVLISYLVRVACFQVAVHSVWEGLAERRWTEEELRTFQTALAQQNFVGDLKESLDGERAFGLLAIDLMARGVYSASLTTGANPDERNIEGNAAVFLQHLVPRGWFQMEQYQYARLFEKQAEGVMDVSARRIFPDRLKTNLADLDREMQESAGLKAVGRHRVLARLLLPALGKTWNRAAIAQTAANQAVLGCALERYRLAHGSFPEKLESLVPAYLAVLPVEVMTGENYKYKLKADGTFLLYSVGWDQKDDGGVPGKELFDQKSGDWVWSYPELK